MILNKRTELYYTFFDGSVNGENNILHSFFAGPPQGAKKRFWRVRCECKDGTGTKSEKGINKNGTGMVK